MFDHNEHSVYCASCGLEAPSSPCPQCLAGINDHHLFSRQYEEYFNQRGVPDIHEHTITLSESEHHRLHPTWNREWDVWIHDHPSATPEEIHNQAASMMERHGIDERLIHRYKGYGDET